MKIEEEKRNATGVYIPIKGGAQKPEIFNSNLNSILKMDNNGQKAHNEYLSSFKKKNRAHQQSSYNW